MRDLDEIRKDINAVDDQILALFEQRMDLSCEVAAYKRANHLPVYDAAREAKNLDKFEQKAKNPAYAKWARCLSQELMRYSKELQRQSVSEPYDIASKKQTGEVHIAYQGSEGSYGEEASLSYFGTDNTKFCPVATFADVFSQVADGIVDFGVVPLENSSTGAIGDCYDLLRSYDCQICGEYILPITHNLLAIPGARLSDIREVYSHTQGFEQCSTFLKDYPELNLIPYHNTAVSARHIAELHSPQKAAIASSRAAELYGLSILKPHINNSDHNFTRFVVMSKERIVADGADKISITFGLPHEKGRLCTVMAHFSEYPVNLLKIESRPIPDKNWEYSFYLDFEGNIHDDKICRLLEKVDQDTIGFRLLGNYRAAR